MVLKFKGIFAINNEIFWSKNTERFKHSLKKYLNELEKNHKRKFHDAESFESAKITDILQELVDSGVDVNPIFVEGKWCEIDTPRDLEIARENFL